MPTAVGVAFRAVSRAYWFDPNGLTVREGDRVVVESTRGSDLGVVRVAERQVPEHELQGPLKRILRIASQRDLDQEKRNIDRAEHALRLCRERVAHHGLPMKVLQAEYAFEGNQVTISFAAEARVDFRELVRDLAGQLRCKVQLYQVGARDQAKIIGGVGTCGRTLCCSTFLTEFAPISMKMAKDQSLFVNPVKFSGVCGKLMCCLRYEHETYVDAKRRLPQVDDLVRTPAGRGRVIELNVVREDVRVDLGEDGGVVLIRASEVTVEKAGRRAASQPGGEPNGANGHGDAETAGLED